MNNTLVTALIAHKDWYATEYKKADEEDSAGRWYALGRENEIRLAELGRVAIRETPTAPTLHEVVENLEAYIFQAMGNSNIKGFEARFCVRTQGAIADYLAE